MAKFTHHIFVCCNQRPNGHPRGCCDPDGSEQLRAMLKAELQAQGLKGEVRANRAGCLDQCELGPTVVIYPQEIWYGGVRPEDVSLIVKENLIQNQLLTDLLIPDELLNTKGRGPKKPADES